MASDSDSISVNNEEAAIVYSDETYLLPNRHRKEPEVLNSPVVGDNDCSFNHIVQILDPGSDRDLIDRWTDVAMALNIREETIVSERMALLNETKQMSCVYLDMLIQWRGRNGSEATLHALEEMFRTNGFHETSARLRKNYSDLFGELTTKLKKKRQTWILSVAFIAVLVILSVTGICVIEILRSIQVQYRNSVPALPSVYIGRELTSRAEMNTDKIFQSLIGDNALVFSCIDNYLVQELVKYGNTISITTTLREKSISLRYITGMTQASEFDQICEIRGNLSLHWLRYQNTTISFRWIESCGTDMTFIENAVNVTKETFQENIFSKLPFFTHETVANTTACEIMYTNNLLNQPIIIYGSSGTGKSTLLASIGNAIQKTHNNTIVVFANAAPFLQNVIKNQVERRQAIVNTVIKIACRNKKCENYLLSGISAGTVKLTLLLDAFDQLSSDIIETSLEILKEIRSWNSTILFITTRPNYLTKLEIQLNTMAYRIEPFSVEQQKEYLVKFWYNGHHYLDKERLFSFSTACIDTVQSRLSRKERDFTGIALLAYFMADLYEENATLYADPNDDMADGDPIIDFTSVYHLYGNLVSNRLSRFTNNAHKQKQLELFHAYEAIRIMFPNETIQNYTLPIEDIRKIGIMEMSSDGSGRLEFMHPTFVDYFLAWYTLNCDFNNSLCSKIFQNCLVINKAVMYGEECKKSRIMAYGFQHKLVAYFWDASESLGNIGKLLATSGLDDDVLYATIGDDYMNLFIEFYNTSQVLKGESNNHHNLLEEFVFHSVMHSSLPLVKHIVSQFISNSGNLQNIALCDIQNNTSFLNDLSVLNLSAMRGSFEIFNYIWQYFGIPNMGKFLLHRVVSPSFKLVELDSQEVVDNKVSMVRFLVDVVGSSILDEYVDGHYYQCAPAFYTYSTDLILELIAQGMNTQFICKNHGTGTLLEYVSNGWYFDVEDYHSVLLEIYNRGQLTQKLINYNGTAPVYWNPLEHYVFQFEPKLETLEIFKNVSADFVCHRENITNYQYPSLFSLALASGKTPNSFNHLIPYTPYWKMPNGNNESAFISALSNWHFSAARLFLKLDPEQANIRDTFDYTPLGRTLADFYMNNHLIESKSFVKLLVSHGADVNAKNGNDLVTPLQIAVESADLEVVKYLVTSGANVEYSDVNNNTVLHYALSMYANSGNGNGDNQFEIIRYLVEDKGIQVNLLNKRNLTALEDCIEFGDKSILDLRTLQLFIKHGAASIHDMANKVMVAVSGCQVRRSEDSKVFREAAESAVHAGASWDYKDITGGTYLHVAVGRTCLNAVIYLIESGCDVNAEDHRGRTPMSFIDDNYLKDKDGKAIFYILKEHGAHI